MNGLYVITGPPGSGKTPILRELMAMGFAGVEEPARLVLAEQRAVGGDGVHDKDPRLFCDLMLSRAIADFHRMSEADTPVFFDRGIPDHIGYAELFGLDTSEAASAARAHRYGEIVFVLPSWPEIYVTDSERTMTFEAAEVFGDRIRDVYAELAYRIVVVPRDTIAARAMFIVEALGLSGEVTRVG